MANWFTVSILKYGICDIPWCRRDNVESDGLEFGMLGGYIFGMVLRNLRFKLHKPWYALIGICSWYLLCGKLVLISELGEVRKILQYCQGKKI